MCCSDGEDDDISEDLDAALRSLQALTTKVRASAATEQAVISGSAEQTTVSVWHTAGSTKRAVMMQERNASSTSQYKPATPPGQVVRRPEVIDDFIRNFYVKMGLTRTAEVFEAEWYELKATGRLEGANTTVPDIYMRNGVSQQLPRNHSAVAAAAAVHVMLSCRKVRYQQVVGSRR